MGESPSVRGDFDAVRLDFEVLRRPFEVVGMLLQKSLDVVGSQFSNHDVSIIRLIHWYVKVLGCIVTTLKNRVYSNRTNVRFGRDQNKRTDSPGVTRPVGPLCWCYALAKMSFVPSRGREPSAALRPTCLTAAPLSSNECCLPVALVVVSASSRPGGAHLPGTANVVKRCP